MPTGVGDTPLGGTISFGTQGGTYNFTIIGSYVERLARVSATHLGTPTHQESLPGDLIETDPIPISLQFSHIDGLPNLGVVEDITITFPDAGDQTAGNIAGTGFLEERSFPTMDISAVDELMIAELSVVYDGGYGGGTPPAWTPGTENP